MQFPPSDLVPNFLRRFLRDGWYETTKDPSPTLRFPRPKRESQKVELLVRVTLLPIGILAIDHLGLLRMQFQSTLLQPCRYFDTHQVRFPLCSAMDNDIVRVPLERQVRPVSPHPYVERVMPEQIGQQGADHSSLPRASFTPRQTSLLILRRRFQPPLDVQFHPPLLRVFPDRFHHHIVIAIL